MGRLGVDHSIEAEAQAQAICMQTKDYERAYAPSSKRRSRYSKEIKVKAILDGDSCSVGALVCGFSVRGAWPGLYRL